MNSKINVQEVDVKAQRRKRRLKIAFLSLGAVVILVGGSGLAWYFTPPALPGTIEEARAVVESPRYERLSKAQKQPYLDVIREQFGSLDRDARRAMMDENEQMRDALRASRDAEREAFTKAYVLATPQERQAMMDEMEAERDARRGERGGRPPENGDGPPEGGPETGERGGGGERSGGGGGRGGPSNERVNDRATNGSAQNSQLRSEMRNERRQQRDAAQNGN